MTITFWNFIQRSRIGQKMIHLCCHPVGCRCFSVGAGGENNTFNYFYELVFKGYTLIIFGISFITFVLRTFLLYCFFALFHCGCLLIDRSSYCCWCWCSLPCSGRSHSVFGPFILGSIWVGSFNYLCMSGSGRLPTSLFRIRSKMKTSTSHPTLGRKANKY